MATLLDIDSIRDHLEHAHGREYWRSLEEAAASPAVQDMLGREFPSRASEWMDPVGRREFLKLMGASLALAGVGACTRQPEEMVVPYVRQPEQMIPGQPLFFATAMVIDGYANGLLVESHAGRPTKVEGNPNHSASLGATNAFAQASVLSLYDPDRAQEVTYRGESRSWEDLLAELQTVMGPVAAQEGAGLRILTEASGSPTLSRQMQQLSEKLPAARWHQYSPVNRDNVLAGARLAFGEAVEPRYHFDRAEVIVSIDADFLDAMPGSVRHARDFITRRKLGTENPSMSRLYAIESTPSVTGARADHRLPLRQGEVEIFARTLVARITGGSLESIDGLSDDAGRWVEALARDLGERRGAGLVVTGPTQPPFMHALVHLANQALGNSGTTVEYLQAVEAGAVENEASLRLLADEIDAGVVTTLVIIGSNPVYSAPADLRFAQRLEKVAFKVAMSSHLDETGELADWHVPQTHYLEEWSDARAFDGTASIVQPLIAPLFGGRSPHELVSMLSGSPGTAYDLVRETWRPKFEKLRDAGSLEADLTFDLFWRRVLHDGVIPGSASVPRSVVADGAAALAMARFDAAPGIELIFRPDPSIYDGRFANNGWLQELPKPVSKLTWDNAALVSPRTAERLGIKTRVAFQGGEHGQTITPILELTSASGTLRVPAWVTPGQADDCVTLHLGYGRSRAGRVGSDVGANANLLRNSAAPWGGGRVEVAVTNDTAHLACTQGHHSMEGRDIVRSGSLAEHLENPGLLNAHKAPSRELSLYPSPPGDGYQWGMAIDLSACIGCNACIVACQSENNVPVVGKAEVLRGREMHWLRVDRYHSGSLDAPETFFQPIPCMHCENAPCETVCPVSATVHSTEGLNEMVYNRCVGTRYCSNNCPYKVRRFNFFLYGDWDTPSLALGRNPDVSVRSRGVMEKCTYCVQRINAVKINAKKEDRLVADGEIRTACEAVCPTQAIIFGNINDPESRVSQLKKDQRNYGLLAGLNTRPRTTYLADVRNPNPEL